MNATKIAGLIGIAVTAVAAGYLLGLPISTVLVTAAATGFLKGMRKNVR